MALTGLAIGAALALAKSELVDRPQANKKRQLAAATAAYSPWTGMKPNEVTEADPIGGMLAFGGAGAAIGSSVHKANSEAALNEALAKNPNVMGSSLSTNAPNTPLGGGQMSNELGKKGNSFSSSNNWKGVSDNTYTPGNDKDVLVLRNQYALGSADDPAVKYKSLYARGQSPNNPEDTWTKNGTNPFQWTI